MEWNIMVRIVIEAGTHDAAEQLTRAVNLLSPKILLYSKTEHWLVVRKTEADAAVVALKHHGNSPWQPAATRSSDRPRPK